LKRKEKFEKIKTKNKENLFKKPEVFITDENQESLLKKMKYGRRNNRRKKTRKI